MNPKLLQQYLESVAVPDGTRADAWDIFHQSRTPAEFHEKMQKLGFPDDAMDRLWEMRWSPQYRDSGSFFSTIKPSNTPEGSLFTDPLGPGSVGYKQQDKSNLQSLPPFSGFSQAELEAGRLGASVPGTPGTVPDPSKPYSDRQNYFQRPGFVQYGEPGFLRTPEEQERINNLPLRERVSATAPPHARHIQQQTEEIEAAKDWLQEKGGQAGADFFEYVASHPGLVPPGDFGSLSPNSVPPETKLDLPPIAKGVVRGVGKFAGSTAVDPLTYGLLSLSGMGKVGRTLMSAGFAGQMGYNTIQGAGQLGAIWDRDDIPRDQKIELGTQLALNTLMAGGAGAHALRAPFLSDHPLLSSIPERDRAVIASRVQQVINGSSEPFLLDGRENSVTANSDGFSVEDKNLPLQSVATFSRNNPKPDISPVHAVDARVRPLEQQLLFVEPDSTPTLNMLEKAARGLPGGALEKYLGYERGLKTYLDGVDSDSPWRLRDSIRAVKQTSQVGTLGPSSRNLGPSELRESYKSFARSLLDRYENATPDPDVLGEGQELHKAIQNSGDPDLAARLEDLRKRANPEEPDASEKTWKTLQNLRDAINGSPENDNAPSDTEISPAKARSIARAKARFNPEQFRQVTEANTNDALAEYGKVKSQISDLQGKLDLAKSAQEKGFTRGAKSPEEMKNMEGQLSSLQDEALYLFKKHAQGLSDEEAESLIEGIEKPVYKQIGQALQLHKLLRDDESVRDLKQALREDISPQGLSPKSRKLVEDILGDEGVGARLTKGPGGQRTRIYDKLGYTPSDEQSIRLLKFIPRGPKGQEILEQVEAARNIIRDMLQNETDPTQQKKLSTYLETHSRDLIRDGVVIAKAGDYKYNPILTRPRVKGKAMISNSEFFNAKLPGELQEINLQNLAAILGKEKVSTKSGRLTPEQKSLLESAPSDEARKAYKAEFAREYVEGLRDNLIENVKKNVKLVKAVKEARGIPSTQLTPLETKLAAAVSEMKGKASQVSVKGLLGNMKENSQPKNSR